MTPRLQKAIDFMKAAHRSIDQRRKDNVRLYEVHPLDVLARLQAAGVEDEDVLIAGLLHDVVEDVFPKNAYYGGQLIIDTFGEQVAGLVEELTDEFTKEKYPHLNRKARKQLERERYLKMSHGALLVKLADVASNLNDDGTVLESDGRVEVGFNRMFIKEKELCLPYLGDPENEVNIRLWNEAHDILQRQKKKFGVK